MNMEQEATERGLIVAASKGASRMMQKRKEEREFREEAAAQ